MGGAESRRFEGVKLEDFSGTNQYTHPHGRPELGLLVSGKIRSIEGGIAEDKAVDINHHLPEDTKVRARGPAWQG